MPTKKPKARKINSKFEPYRKLLIHLKEQIQGDIRQMSDENSASNPDVGDVSGHALHMADVATDMYDREFNLGLASNDREVLVRVNEALDRIDDGAFGLCVQCRKPITIARLKAIPYVETCLKCQENLEQRRS